MEVQNSQGIKAQLDEVLSTCPSVIYTMSYQNDIPVVDWISENIESITGHPIKKITEPGWWTQNIHPDDQVVESEANEALLKHGSLSYEYRIRYADGQYRWIYDQMRVLRHSDGSPRRIVGSWHDITREKSMTMALEQRDQLLSRLSKWVPGMLYQMIMQPDGRCYFPYVSAGIQDIYGVSPDAVAEDAEIAIRHIHPADKELFHRSIQESARQLRTWHCDFRIQHNKRGLRWARGEAAPELLADGNILWHGHISDATEQKNLENALKEQRLRLQQLAHYDPLTGLPNRALFADRIYMAIEQAKRKHQCLAVVYIDLDNFKPVNDTLGHSAGDQLLQQVAKRLLKSVRNTDTVARIGGDEFVLLIADTGPHGYMRSINQIIDFIRRPIPLQNQSVELSASIGIATYPQDETEPDALVRYADLAMYKAKEKGRNQICHFHDLSQ
ncbi:hypothetical protein CWE09_04940 [Aliidiomarina minuta]|uniref:Sensor domain-containing diguanylate cyclase n=1 Tax=Aliidiomarina minuta TaxID=880057 RepID=A0A432W7Z1_9GAMM|nr:sensor domain-containing diguanylate cyclase [Aliidiomarina minuta]RUO26076.1 hypothetical protein CWE09_04940 [Aliidiomarina minuta]